MGKACGEPEPILADRYAATGDEAIARSPEAARSEAFTNRYNARHERSCPCVRARSPCDAQRCPEVNPEVEAARRLVANARSDPAAHYALAQAHDRAGDASAAIASLAEAVRLAPQFAEAHNLMGILRASRGETLAAIDCFRRAIDAKPAYARAHNNLGNSLKAIGRTIEAEQAIASSLLPSACRIAPKLCCAS
jgi:Flp pilus assembly protein TadD